MGRGDRMNHLPNAAPLPNGKTCLCGQLVTIAMEFAKP
jgi:hypothetical protein